MHELALRTRGFIFSLLLTILAYFIIVNPEIFHFNQEIAAIVIFSLALLQALIQLIFFIDVWEGKGTIWNAGIFISTVFIIFIVVYFSIWIMNHLNYNMQ